MTVTEAKPDTMVKLELGIGQSDKQEGDGWVGIDIVDGPNVDVIHDLFEFPWPFDDDSVDEVFASHFIEHVPDLIATMNELHRIMKPGAKARLVHPYLRSDRAFQDPTHKQFLSEASWPYYVKEWRDANKLDHYPISADFEIEHMFFSGINPPWDQKHPEAQQFAIQMYWNVVQDMVDDLKKKGE